MKRIWIVCVLVIGLLGGLIVLAQDEGETITISGHDLQIMPLSVVAESDVQVFDVTDTTARVNFVGTIPLACYLVYGTDESFGFVTNDPDMAQAAIIDHNPVLLDLEPDTEYVFRMQGVGEDGVIYVSELYRFRTLPASDVSSENLLSPENGAVVIEVSSNFGNQPNDGRRVWGSKSPSIEDSSVTQPSDSHGAALLTLICRQPAAPRPPLRSCHLPLGPGSVVQCPDAVVRDYSRLHIRQSAGTSACR